MQFNSSSISSPFFYDVVMAFITDVSIVMSYSHSWSPNQSNELGYILLRSSTLVIATDPGL